MTNQRDSVFRALHTLRQLPAPPGDMLSRRFDGGKLEFVVLAEQAAIVLRPSEPGAFWVFDGYKSDSLFLGALYQLAWLSGREVTFRLEFRPRETILDVRSCVPEVLKLYRAYVAAMDRLRPAPLRGEWIP